MSCLDDGKKETMQIGKEGEFGGGVNGKERWLMKKRGHLYKYYRARWLILQAKAFACF
jgi:hypothetical protein